MPHFPSVDGQNPALVGMDEIPFEYWLIHYGAVLVHPCPILLAGAQQLMRNGMTLVNQPSLLVSLRMDPLGSFPHSPLSSSKFVVMSKSDFQSDDSLAAVDLSRVALNR